MTAPSPIPSLVMPLGGPAGHGAALTAPVVREPSRRRPPLPQLPPPLSPGRTVYGLTSIGGNGRLNERTIPRLLSWSAGIRLDIQEDHGLIVVVADPHGVFRVSAEGFVLLPAAARRWCGLAAGDRVFLVADRSASWLVVHPPAAVDAMVAAAHTAVWGGEDA
jgi:hypothetical protein